MQNERILLASPHMCGEEMKYIRLAFDTNWVAPLGANVTGLEKDICDYTGSEYAVALSAGTAALHLALIEAGVQTGDMVFCQSLTFSASTNPIIYQGAKPVFLDSERETWNLDPAVLRKAIAEYGVPKALMLVHLYGMPAKLDEITAICEECGITLIEDAAESLGSFYHGKACGTFGTLGALSFNGNKIITTSGGGMLLCKTEAAAKHALKLATQAREPAPWYQHEELGYNYRMSNICAGIGRGQMEALEQRVSKKREIFDTYREAFADLPVSWAAEDDNTRANRWLSVMLLNRDCGVTPTQLLDALNDENIEGRHMWKPMHMQPVFAQYPFVSAEDTCVSEELFLHGVCLPSDTKMTAEQQIRVIRAVRRVFHV